MDFSNYKFRCHSLGHIMTNAKGKSNMQIYNETRIAYSEKLILIHDATEKQKTKLTEQCIKLKEKRDKYEKIKHIPHLSESCKTHLCDLYTFLKYNRTEDIKSKYLEKGLHMEENAITLYSLVTGKFHKKNNIRFENNYISGLIDFESEDDYINDTKVNWSIFQYNRTLAKPLKPLYVWQMKGYLWLWNKTKGRIINCLLDTPEHLIKAEQRKVMYELVGRGEFISDEERELYQPAMDEVRKNNIYTDIANENRIHTFDVELAEEDKIHIAARIVDCRYFLNHFGEVREEETEIETE